MTRVAIVGAGAIGGYVAAALAQVEGLEVSVVARGHHLAAIQTNGLTLLTETARRTVTLTATDDMTGLGPQDIVFNCLKAHQAWAATGQLTALLGPDTTVVACQNGLPWWYFHGAGGALEGQRLDSLDRGNRQWDTLGPDRMIGCVIYTAGSIEAPGVVRLSFGNKLVIGEPGGTTSPRISQIAALLTTGGIDAPISGDIRSEIWKKLWGNMSFNPISTLVGTTMDLICADTEVAGLTAAMMEEVRPVAEAMGVTFEVTATERVAMARLVGAHKTSMLQDLEAGKPLELDALVGSVVECARLTGHPTPLLDAVLALAKLKAGALGLYPTYPNA